MVKQMICFFGLLYTLNSLFAQDITTRYPDSLFSTYYHQRNTLFSTLPKTSGDILFVGNSITDGGEWGEIFNDLRIKNRGISGDVTAGVINRIEGLLISQPAKIFLMIGVNDLAGGVGVDSVVTNIFRITSLVKERSPQTKIYIQSILPVNPSFNKFTKHAVRANEIRKVNAILNQEQLKKGYVFIDLHTAFCDSAGNLNSIFTNDGLHLKAAAYQYWKHQIYGHVYDLSPKAAIIPTPTSISWGEKHFELFDCKFIVCTDPAFNKEAIYLQEKLKSFGIVMQVVSAIQPGKKSIVFKTGLKILAGVSTENYQLVVHEQAIELSGTTSHGIFNGIQTLMQLARDRAIVDECSITDNPAFAVRGYMFDVGRNYQSIQLIKQQLDVMAAYKLNVYHMHLTEDIAWRIESKLYPQLNAGSSMLRNKGEYYTYSEIREIQQYCADRHIEFIPEIDMPGHSAAFKRAMGVDMQSAEGKAILKNILTEFLSNVDVKYIHIGGDEVEYKDKNFLEEIAAFLTTAGKNIIAWDPGGKVPVGSIHQLWNGNRKQWKNEQCIDSRHLYLNHLDPLEGVSSIFNHYILDAERGDSIRLGAILCNWPDRRLANEADGISMSATYPSMLAFAERTWQGGGYRQFNSDIGKPGDAGFAAFSSFEKKLLDHKKNFFNNMPFPYQKQADIEWSLIGPFPNGGDSSKIFSPEQNNYLDTVDLTKKQKVYGGTIWLRHFWHPMISSHVQNPTDSTTWYAVRKIFSETDGYKNCWIGFNNISRSNIPRTPVLGTWDYRGSKIWLNGVEVSPPKWKFAGRKPDMEDPLFDEGYEYREPTKLWLKKGWNTILVKAPVSSFKAYWYEPVKWMFTMVIVEE